MSVLFILATLSAFSVFLLKAISIESKLISAVKIKNDFYLPAIVQLVQLQGIIPNKTCEVPYISSGEIKNLPSVFWQNNACKIKVKSLTYYYFYEFLTLDACSMIENYDNKQNLGVAYYRLTLKLELDKPKFNILLQSTIAKPSVAEHICSLNIHKVIPGMQMIRTL